MIIMSAPIRQLLPSATIRGRYEDYMKIPDVNVNPALRAKLSEGHPWVYRNHVSGGQQYRSGTWVRVHAGNWHAIGLWDATSPIAVRIFARSGIPDRRWIRDQVRLAYALRAPVRAQQTTAWRWIFGESDGIPGLVVDLYGAYAVVQTYADSV